MDVEFGSARTKLVGLCHVSNVLGCVNPIERVAKKCQSVDAKLLVDACQSVPWSIFTVYHMNLVRIKDNEAFSIIFVSILKPSNFSGVTSEFCSLFCHAVPILEHSSGHTVT